MPPNYRHLHPFWVESMVEKSRSRLLLEYDFNASKLRVLDGLAISLSAISFLGGLFVVTSFLCFDKLRAKFAFEHVANMALADMGSCFTYFLGAPRDRSPLCTSQAVLQQYFELASVLWATVIATTLSLAIWWRVAPPADEWRPAIYGVAWGLPMLVSLLPFSTGSYGSAGAWCWIRPKPRAESHAWRFSIFYGPIWVAIIYNAIVYSKAAVVLKRLSSTVAGDEASIKLKQTIARLLRYPLILVVCWTLPTVNRIQQIVQRQPVFALYVMTVITRALLGFLNALNFGTTPIVMAHWVHFYRRHAGFRSLSAIDACQDTPEAPRTIELATSSVHSSIHSSWDTPSTTALPPATSPRNGSISTTKR